MEKLKVINVSKDENAKSESRKWEKEAKKKGKNFTAASEHSLCILDKDMESKGYTLEEYSVIPLKNSMIEDGELQAIGAHAFLAMYVNNKDKDDCKIYFIKGLASCLLNDNTSKSYDVQLDIFSKLVSLAIDTEESDFNKACAKHGVNAGKPRKPKEIHYYK